VNDSTPENEVQETINKSMSMRKAVALAEMFSRSEPLPITGAVGNSPNPR